MTFSKNDINKFRYPDCIHLGRRLLPNKQDVADQLDKLQLGMDEVDLANKLKESEQQKACHSNGMKLLTEVRDWLIQVKSDL